MAGILRGRSWWWKFFKNLLFNLHTTIRGYVQLGYGRHEIEIQIDSKVCPINVFLNCRDQYAPVCAGQISMASANLTSNNSFIIHANIESQSCLIEWLVEYDPNFDE